MANTCSIAYSLIPTNSTLSGGFWQAGDNPKKALKDAWQKVKKGGKDNTKISSKEFHTMLKELHFFEVSVILIQDHLAEKQGDDECVCCLGRTK